MTKPAKLAWIGRPYFAEALRPLGWDVFLYENRNNEPRTFTWKDIVALTGGEPDVLVLGDKSHPPAFLGIERFPCLTVFHSVDSHIHSWHPYYAQAFDLCSVSLRDHLPLFMGKRLTPEQAIWSPPFAPDELALPAAGEADKDWDLLFVGTVDPDKTPGRHAFLKSLSERFPGLCIQHGPYGELYPRARLVLNIAEKGDLNFRVFEALACGSCLLTPAVGHGFSDLFDDGRDLYAYPQGDMDTLLQLAHDCLNNPVGCGHVARCGYEKVDQRHRARNRAKEFDFFLRSALHKDLRSRRLQQAREIHRAYLRLIYLHWSEAVVDIELKERYLQAAHE